MPCVGNAHLNDSVLHSVLLSDNLRIMFLLLLGNNKMSPSSSLAEYIII